METIILTIAFFAAIFWISAVLLSAFYTLCLLTGLSNIMIKGVSSLIRITKGVYQSVKASHSRPRIPSVRQEQRILTGVQ